MNASLKSCLLLLAALMLAAPIHAQNLLANPEFDDGQGLDSWFTNATGSWTLDADVGSCTQSNAALGTSGGPEGNQFLTMYSQDCIAIDPVATPTLYLGATYKTAAQVYARLYLQYFSDGSCASHSGYSGFVSAATSPTWTSILGALVIPGNVASARVWADFNPQVGGLPQYTGTFDRIYLGASALVFADPFEADGGSPCRWSSTQGLVP